MIIVTLSKHDLDELKHIFGLAIAEETTYITFPSHLLLDMNGNMVVPIPPSDSQRALSTIPDTTPPELIYWDLDMDNGRITLMFMETIDSSTFSITELHIVSDTNSTICYQLTGGDSSQENSLYIIAYITKEDLDTLKMKEGLATSPNSTFAAFSELLVGDMTCNDVSVPCNYLYE